MSSHASPRASARSASRTTRPEGKPIGLLEADDATLVARLVPPTPTAYHRLNPTTKAVIATVESLAAFVLGGYAGPLAIIAMVLVCAVVARVAGRLVRVSALFTLPIAISVVLVSVFTRAGTTVLFTIGPFDATLEGVEFAAQTVIRLFAISTALSLFGMTTDPRAFVLDLERRGLSPRFAFVAAATVEAVPAMAARAGTIAAAQRSRGLDTEGSVLARMRGFLPLIVPVVLSSLTEVEERSLALEVRAFGRPGKRHLLWAPGDRSWERGLRWGLALLLVVVVIARVTGVLTGAI